MKRPAAVRPSGAAPLPPLGPALEFMRQVWAVDRGFQAASGKAAMPVGVTVPEHLVMRVVGRFPGISAGQLARILHARPSTLTFVLGRLERRGLLTRRTDPRDSRRAALGLTEPGWQLDGKAGGAVEEQVRRALSHLGKADVRAAARVLSAVAAALDSLQ
jgi:MarR family transcriptional regulator, organic hydroperoxide resistance regulator